MLTTALLLIASLAQTPPASPPAAAPAAPPAAAPQQSPEGAARARMYRSRSRTPTTCPRSPSRPPDFDASATDVPHGKLEMIAYDSKSVGTTRKMQVYTPPGYSPRTRSTRCSTCCTASAATRRSGSASPSPTSSSTT